MRARRGWKVVCLGVIASAPLALAGESQVGPYLGQPLPGRTAELFAPGIVNVGLPVRDVTMTPDGNEIYFGGHSSARTAIFVTRREADGWSEPRVAPFSNEGLNLEPCISPDGQRFFFLSTRPQAGQPPKAGWAYQDIWVMAREGDRWGPPRNLGAPVDSDAPEYYPSVTRDGTLYFTREAEDGKSAIYRARFANGAYQTPTRLPQNVNSGESQFNAFVAPDESFVIVPVQGRSDSLGGIDYYVVFRRQDDTWSQPLNLGPTVNSDSNQEWSASLSPDAKVLFFMSARPEAAQPSWAGKTLRDVFAMSVAPGSGQSSIYWIDASLLGELRTRAVW
jgi:hypothetical protein